MQYGRKKNLGGRWTVDIGWAWLLDKLNTKLLKVKVWWVSTTKRRWFFPGRTCSWRELFLTASALKYGGVNTLFLGESLPLSLSVGTVLFENESRFVHLIISQYECMMNCLWTAQCLRVTVPLVLFHTWLPENQIFGGWATLKENFSRGRTPDPPPPSSEYYP